MQMNKCIDQEDMLTFAMDPLLPENAEIATHLLSCQNCREEFHLALQVLETDRIVPTQQDMEDAVTATRQLSGKKKWDKLNDLAEAITRKFNAAISSFSARIPAKNLFAPASGMVFAASASAGRSTVGHDQPPVITFESTVSPGFKEYWKMNLHFPASVSKSSMLTLKLYDAQGKSLPSGKLTFQGRKLNVTAGIAVLSLTDFVASAKTPGITYQFPDGTNSEGVIKFLPDLARV